MYTMQATLRTCYVCMKHSLAGLNPFTKVKLMKKPNQQETQLGLATRTLLFPKIESDFLKVFLRNQLNGVGYLLCILTEQGNINSNLQ